MNFKYDFLSPSPFGGMGLTGFGDPEGGRISNAIIPAKPAIIPTGYTLENYPNPFRATTQIQYAIATDAQVSLAVYNPLGQKLVQLVNSRVATGYHTVNFDASSLIPGVYYCKLQVVDADKKTFEIIKKMVVIK